MHKRLQSVIWGINVRWYATLVQRECEEDKVVKGGKHVF